MGEESPIYWIGPFDLETVADEETVTSRLDIAATDVELLESEEATRDFVGECGHLKFNVVKEVIILVAAMDKMSDAPGHS